MDNREKLNMMNKILRELDDINNSCTSLLKKLAQAESDNINLGNKLLEDKLPDIYEEIDGAVTSSASLITEFTAARDKFISDHKLDEGLQEE